MSRRTSDQERETTMSDDDPRPRILASLEESHRAWQDYLMSLPAEVATRRTEGDWSPVDAWIHVTAWKANALAVARLAADPDAGIDPTKGAAGNLHLDVEEFNDRMLVERADWTPEQALAWAGEVDGGLHQAIGALGPELLLRHPSGTEVAAWCARPLMVHPGEHLEDLRGRALSPSPS
jgi:hypothetical protein